MRLFVALEIPSEIQTLLGEASTGARRELPKARWVRPELLHLTLVFLGETDAELVASLDEELGQAFAAQAAFEMMVTGTGAFPPRGRARVLWAGIEASGDLAGLQAAARGAAGRVVRLEDGKKGRRAYHPHVTLARCRPTWPGWAVDKLRAGFGDRHSRPFPVAHGSLIESKLRLGGPRYRTSSPIP